MRRGTVTALVTTLALTAVGTPASAAVRVDDVPLTAYLSPAAADAVLSSWGLGAWRRATVVPPALRFTGTCSTDPRGGVPRVLSQRDEASIRSVIARRDTVHTAALTYQRLVERVDGCAGDHAAHERLLRGRIVRTHAGVATLFAVDLGQSRSAHRLEYVVVARSGRAAEVSTLHAFAQDTLPPRTWRDLAATVVRRLGTVS